MNIRQIAFSLLSLYFPGLAPPPDSSIDVQEPKSIVVIGAGSAGLAVLKTLLDLPHEIRNNWNIVLYEQTEDVAGVWLPDPRSASPADIPYTPLYPLLHTNTPVPSMTYPAFPFTPGTPIYPSHEHIRAYHKRYAAEYNLDAYIKFRHTVSSTQWSGDLQKGFWNITLLDDQNRTIQTTADHLVVASGNHHIPHVPEWTGQREWLDSGRHLDFQREIRHSVYYREPQRYTDRTLLIVGGGASGQDAAIQTANLTRKARRSSSIFMTYLSTRHDVVLPPGVETVVFKPEISHFTPNTVVFVDGTELQDVDAVLLATGYQQRKPFLEAGGAITVDPSAGSNSSSSQRNGALVTNLRYIFPLYRHTLSLSSEYPVNALAFVGLPTFIANCASDFAQGLFVAHAIANPSILPGRDELLGELAFQEEEVRRHGLDPYIVGHGMLSRKSASDYQDDLVDFLKRQKAIPDDGKKFLEQWRRDISDYDYLKRGWKRIEELGQSAEWLKGVETEGEWSDLLQRVNAWQERWEKEKGVPFVQDIYYAGFA